MHDEFNALEAMDFAGLKLGSAQQELEDNRVIPWRLKEEDNLKKGVVIQVPGSHRRRVSVWMRDRSWSARNLSLCSRR